MRTIKFRGRRLDNQEWAFGDLLTSPNGGAAIRVSHKELYAVEPATVGQFTGLFDKNGTEIYEGDITKSINGSLDVVSYDEIAFNLMTAYATAPNGTCVSFFGKNNPLKGIEIIGNLHDQPELLKNE